MSQADSQPYSERVLSIKAWAEEDRPREKLIRRGRHSLSDAELLAIVLGSGTSSETAVGLAQRILQGAHNNLLELGKCTLAELKRFRGVGEAKAVAIIAALELGRRRQLSPLHERPQVRSSRDAYLALTPFLIDLSNEAFRVLLLNRANRVIGNQKISEGGVAGTVVDAKVVFRKAIEGAACSLILAHNHPSGNLQPSQADIDLTRKLCEAGKTLDIIVLDHLIIADSGYFSFADEGLI